MNENRYVYLLRAQIAGARAVAMRTAAEALFETGGKRLLAEGTRQSIQKLAESTSKAVLTRFAPLALAQAARATGAQIVAVAKDAAVGAETTALALAKGAAPLAMQSAAKEVLKGTGKAAGLGFVVDGVIGGVEATRAYKRGEMTRNEAATYAAKEAVTGAVATGAGVALAAGVVAVTGGLAAPVVFVIGAGGAIGAKQGLRRLLA